MTRSMKSLLLGATLLVALAPTADAAVLEGRIVNGTTGEEGTAERIELMDLTQGMTPMATLENVTGSFRFDEVPEVSAAHFLLRVTADGVSYTESVQAGALEEPIEVAVYESTTDRSQIELPIHHVLFQRNVDHMQVTELLQFDNGSEPALAVAASAGPLRVHLPHDIHGEIEASVGAGSMPLKLPLIETSEPDVYTVDYPLKPGSTRLVVRYLIGYETESLQWRTNLLYPTGERRVLVSPPDVQVEAEKMIASGDSELEGFAVYSGLPAEAGETWSVAMRGGSPQALETRGGGQTQADASRQIQEVRVRPHRFTESRTWLMLGLGLFLLGALGVVASRRDARVPTKEEQDPRREKLSRLSDRYVSGAIDRATFEAERDRILHGGKKRSARPVGAKS